MKRMNPRKKLAAFLMNLIIFALLSSVSGWAARGKNEHHHPPIWKLERDGQISHVIATVPIPVPSDSLPPYLKPLLTSHPVFLTDVAMVDRKKTAEELLQNIREKAGRDVEEVSLGYQLDKPQWRYI